MSVKPTYHCRTNCTVDLLPKSGDQHGLRSFVVWVMNRLFSTFRFGSSISQGARTTEYRVRGIFKLDRRQTGDAIAFSVRFFFVQVRYHVSSCPGPHEHHLCFSEALCVTGIFPASKMHDASLCVLLHSMSLHIFVNVVLDIHWLVFLP